MFKESFEHLILLSVDYIHMYRMEKSVFYKPEILYLNNFNI